MNRRNLFLALVIGALTFLLVMTGGVVADEFYQGKMIRFIVGYRSGGGYDTYTRALARHFGKHVPGNPHTLVENMPGAAGIVAAKQLFSKIEADGLTLSVFNSAFVVLQALEDKRISFDTRKLGWLGAMTVDSPVCAVMGFTGLKTLDDVLSSEKELRYGSPGAGTMHDLSNLMAQLLKAPVKVIAGFKGSSGVRLGMQRREVDGMCLTWGSMSTTGRSMLDAEGGDKLIPYIIEGKHDDPEVKNLPQFTEVIKDKEALAAFKAWSNQLRFFRPIVAPPGIPAERLAVLRAAFKKTMEDPDFLAETRKAKLEVQYTSPGDIERYVDEILSIPDRPKEKLRSIILAPKRR